MCRYHDKLLALPGKENTTDEIDQTARQQTAMRQAAGIPQPVIPAPPKL